MHSLVRFSKRTTEHRLPSSLTGGSPHGHSSRDLVCPVARSPTEFRLYFSSLLGILFSVRSRYLFAIGLEECLAFPVDARDVHEEYPIPASLELTHVVLRSDTGLSPCIALRFRRLLGTGRTLMVSPAPHVLADSVWAGPRSLAVTNGIAVCVLFLLLLRCFNSERSPLREAIAVGIPIRRSRVLGLRATPSGFSQLGTSVVGSRAEPFTSWHSSQFDGCHTSDPDNCRVQWTPGSHVHTVSSRSRGRECVRPFPSALTRDGASVLRDSTERRLALKECDSGVRVSRHGPAGIRTQGVLLAKEVLYR